MKLLFLFFRVWLLFHFALVFFVVPLYLIAIYPDVPKPYLRMMKGLGYGVLQAPASEFGFWYRFLACGGAIVLGLLLIHRWSRGQSSESDTADSLERERGKKRRKKTSKFHVDKKQKW